MSDHINSFVQENFEEYMEFLTRRRAVNSKHEKRKFAEHHPNFINFENTYTELREDLAELNEEEIA